VSTTADGTLYRFGALTTTGAVRMLQGPSNTGSPLGVAVLLIQAAVFLVTGLLALPTSRITERFRPVAAVRAPRVDVRSIEPRAETVVRTPEQAMARELQSVEARQPEEVGSWR
jgi:hypothetical protein